MFKHSYEAYNAIIEEIDPPGSYRPTVDGVASRSQALRSRPGADETRCVPAQRFLSLLEACAQIMQPRAVDSASIGAHLLEIKGLRAPHPMQPCSVALEASEFGATLA